MAKKKIKKAVKKVLDKTELDEKIVDAYEHAKETGLIDRCRLYIWCEFLVGIRFTSCSRSLGILASM